ncbi:hypothetical protein QTI17_28560, partial [Variovorax sp. J31P179]|uniref:hypothetical protein n=1 Tax=Variovorax sp. J31P179 TaxID=3053508 RepID=UPI002578D97B
AASTNCFRTTGTPRAEHVAATAAILVRPSTMGRPAAYRVASVLQDEFTDIDRILGISPSPGATGKEARANSVWLAPPSNDHYRCDVYVSYDRSDLEWAVGLVEELRLAVSTLLGRETRFFRNRRAGSIGHWS